MGLPGRTTPAAGDINDKYRYSHNGQEKDNDIFIGALSAEYWEYDSRTGRRWETDPISRFWESPYACFSNNPIAFNDIDGLAPGGGGKNKSDQPKFGKKHTKKEQRSINRAHRRHERYNKRHNSEKYKRIRGIDEYKKYGGGNNPKGRKAPDFGISLGNIVGTETKPWIIPLYQSQSVTYYNTQPKNNGFAPSEPNYTALMQGRIVNNFQWVYYQGKEKIKPMANGLKFEAPSWSEVGLLYRLMSRDISYWVNISIDVGGTAGLTFAEVFFDDNSGNTVTEPNLVVTNPLGNQRYSNIGKSGSLIFKLNAETVSGFALFVLVNVHHLQGDVIKTSIGDQQIKQLGTGSITIGGSFTLRARKKKN